MPENRKSKLVFREIIEGAVIQVNCRYNPTTDYIGFMNDQFTMNYHNTVERKYNETHRSEQIEYSKQYQDDHAEKRNVYEKRRQLVTTWISFLGKKYISKNLPKAPEGYVYHHTCYDHKNPEANLVLMSRSSHTQGHHLLRKLGIEIPHINKEK